jgi:hypothetical protein
MTVTATATMPIRAMFFDSPGEVAGALTGALRSADTADEIRGRLGRMAGPAKDAVLGEVGRIAGNVLDEDVGDIFKVVWSKYASLVQAAQETARDPDMFGMIELVTHEVPVTYEPRVEVYLRTHLIATVTMRIALKLTLRGVLIEVQDGCLTGIRAGDCLIEGALAIAGQPVISRDYTLDLPRDVPFRGPIRLAGRAPI